MDTITSEYTLEAFLFIASVLMVLAIFANKASSRFGLPSLVLFLLLGMVAGSEGLGGVEFDNHNLAYAIGSIALAFIIFDGGLSTSWTSIRSVLKMGLSLSLLGVAATSISVGVFSHFVLGLDWLSGFLLGSIISSTDAAAVFGILRTHRLSLKYKVKELLEFEAGSNDPAAIFLTLGLLGVMSSSQLTWSEGLITFSLLLLSQLLIGLLMGYVGGLAVCWVINKSSLEFDGLYSVFVLSCVLLIFSGSALLGGSGFLAVYLLGVVVRNQEVLRKESIARFHDALAWLAQITLFLVLGLLVFPSHLLSHWQQGLLLACFLIFVARPLSVFISLAMSTVSLNEKIFVSWVGLRGGAPIILATLPFTVNFQYSEYFFNLVFVVVIVSVLVQGTSIPWVARKLRIIEPTPATPLESQPQEMLPRGLESITISVGHSAQVLEHKLVEMGLPKEVFLTRIEREGRFLIPRGDTRLKVGDTVWGFARPDQHQEIEELFNASLQIP